MSATHTASFRIRIGNYYSKNSVMAYLEQWEPNFDERNSYSWRIVEHADADTLGTLRFAEILAAWAARPDVGGIEVNELQADGEWSHREASAELPDA